MYFKYKAPKSPRERRFIRIANRWMDATMGWAGLIALVLVALLVLWAMLLAVMSRPAAGLFASIGVFVAVYLIYKGLQK